MLGRTALFSLLMMIASAWAQEPMQIEEQVRKIIEGSRVAIEQGQIDIARKMLEAAIAVRPDNPDVLFLLGTVAGREGRWDDAVTYYRKMLERHPGLIRVRLELARALFELHRDQEASYNFRLALPEVPKDVASNIYLFLSQIEARKRFTYNLSFGLSPDTNINAASDINQLTLFGLPFDLSPSAQQKSGVGIVVNASGEYRVPLSDDFRLRMGGELYRAEYFGHGDFDDMLARLYSGPQYLFNGGDASLLATGTERWFGNAPYNRGYGGRAELNYSLTESIYVQSGLEYSTADYHKQTFQSGHLFTGLVTTSYALTPTSFVSIITGASRTHASSPDFSNWTYRIGLGYQRELPFAVSAYVQPDFLFGDYDEASPSFGNRRLDRVYRVQLSLAKRDYQFHGFIPTFTYNFSRDSSNQPLFAFTRHQFILGFTNKF